MTVVIARRSVIAIAHRGLIITKTRGRKWKAFEKRGVSSSLVLFSHHAAISISADAAAAVPPNLVFVVGSTANNLQIRYHSASITATATSSATASLAASRRGNNANDGAGGGDGDGGGGDFLGTAGKIFFSSLCLFTFGLGVWQTQRYFEKVDMVQKRQEDLKLDPLLSYYDWVAAANTATTNSKRKMTGESELDDSDNAKSCSSDSKSYRRVHLRGTFQHEHEIFIGPRGPPPGALAEKGPNSGRGGGGGGMSSSTQGYIVVTPLVIAKDEGDDATTKNNSRAMKQTKEDEENVVVWVNRGWIPRHFLNHPKSHHRRHHHDPQTHDFNEIITFYSQPTGVIQLLAMESNTDTPGRFAPPSRVMPSSHRAESKVQTIIEGNASSSTTIRNINQELSSSSSSPNLTTATAMNHKKLLWMDRPAMEELTSCQSLNYHPPLFVEINTTTKDTMDSSPSQNNNSNSNSIQYPVKSTQEYVGEFKVTPEIHAAYAVTWFGLSGAGIIMTKKLLSRGRL